jgi:hypothetical protein
LLYAMKFIQRGYIIRQMNTIILFAARHFFKIIKYRKACILQYTFIIYLLLLLILGPGISNVFGQDLVRGKITKELTSLKRDPPTGPFQILMEIIHLKPIQMESWFFPMLVIFRKKNILSSDRSLMSG